MLFLQDISEMCDERPRHRESVVTFLHQMDDKKTSEMHLKHLEVNKKKVTSTSEWLKIHHSGYHDISISMNNLSSMEEKDQSTLMAGI